MVVIKKSDQQEKFSYEKLARSVASANEEANAADAGEALDVELLIAEFQNIVADKEYITTGQINIIVYGLLFSKGALQTLKNYAGFKQYD